MILLVVPLTLNVQGHRQTVLLMSSMMTYQVTNYLDGLFL